MKRAFPIAVVAALCVAVLFTIPTWAEPKPSEIEYAPTVGEIVGGLERGYEIRLNELSAELGGADADIERIKKTPIRKQKTRDVTNERMFATSSEKAEAIRRARACKKSIQETISGLRRDPSRYKPTLRLQTIRSGDVGEIIDHYRSPRLAMIVRTVVNRSELVVSIGNDDYWISGIDTADVVDDQAITSKTIWIVMGTKSYQSPLYGKRTIWHLVAISDKDYKEASSILAERNSAKDGSSKKKAHSTTMKSTRTQ